MIQDLVERSAVKGVVFDLFGTLVKGFSAESYEDMIRKMSDILGVPTDKFFEKWRAKFIPRVTGKYSSMREHLFEIGKEVGKDIEQILLTDALEVRKQYLHKALEPRGESVLVLKLLRDNGYRIGVLTDCSDPVPELWKTHSLARQVDMVIFSCETGIKKPNKTIYNLVCSGLNLQNSECLYVGDGGSNELAGAFNAGLKPIRLDVATFRYEQDSFQAAKVNSLKEISSFLC